MKFLINLVRNLLGGLIAFVSFITRGKKLSRSPAAQRHVDREAESLTLYQFFACPFCIKTRRVIHKLNLNIETKSASEGSPYREELLQGGGKIQTPCLRIETENGVEWMYESKAIISYLEKRFA